MLKRSSIVSVAAGLICLMMFGCSSPTKPEPLAKPTLRTPSQGATFQPDTLTLIWNPSEEATSYSVQVSTNSGFSAFTINASSSSPSFAVTSTLANNTTYYWRVSASVGGQRTSAWSEIFSFTTGVAAPAITNPQDGATLVPDTLTLTWDDPLPGATMHYVQLSTDNTFSATPIDDSSLTPNFAITSPLTDSTTYYWHVKVSIPQGASDWSATSSFTTWEAVPLPTLLTPADGGSGVSLADSLLTWSYSSVWPASYHVQVASSSDFSDVVFDSTGSSLSVALSSLSTASLYYWRVSVTINFLFYIYRTSDWSATWSFTTELVQ
jgi:hypothetical protein